MDETSTIFVQKYKTDFSASKLHDNINEFYEANAQTITIINPPNYDQEHKKKIVYTTKLKQIQTERGGKQNKRHRMKRSKTLCRCERIQIAR